jgi:hypothetical protein
MAPNVRVTERCSASSRKLLPRVAYLKLSLASANIGVILPQLFPRREGEIVDESLVVFTPDRVSRLTGFTPRQLT